MYFVVLRQVVILGETLAAETAHEGSLTGVNSAMFTQFAVCNEALAAMIARVNPRGGVTLDVRQQAFLFREGFVTKEAFQ